MAAAPDPSDLYLRTERLLLRQYRDSDFPLLLDLNSDPAVMKYINGGVPGTREEVERGTVRAKMYRERFQGRLGVFTTELLSNGEFIGWFLLRPDLSKLEDVLNPELGYRFKRKFWGKGYATEGARALIAKAFSELGAESVWAQAVADNAASRRVMEKAGLRFEGERDDAEHGRRVAVYRLRRG